MEEQQLSARRLDLLSYCLQDHEFALEEVQWSMLLTGTPIFSPSFRYANTWHEHPCESCQLTLYWPVAHTSAIQDWSLNERMKATPQRIYIYIYIYAYMYCIYRYTSSATKKLCQEAAKTFYNKCTISHIYHSPERFIVPDSTSESYRNQLFFFETSWLWFVNTGNHHSN